MAKKKSQKKSAVRKAKTADTAGLGCRIVDCILREIEDAGLTPNEHYIKQAPVRGGLYAKSNYIKGDGSPVRQPPAGHVRLSIDLKVGKRRAKG